MTVLVAYASERGSTREMAQHMASRMAVALGPVDCRSVEEVGSVSGYEAVIVGSAIHNQSWLPTAAQFLTRLAPELAKRPSWAFSVGMVDALPKPFRKRAAELQQKRLRGFLPQEIPLRGDTIFSGVYQSDQMPALLRVLFRLTGGRFGDLRNWAAVDAWTDEITAELAKPSSTSSGNITP
ncbi:flavodoxin domain-containing protein [Pseudarthrobacter sulfonivorans]|uniref:flavodoxin domain-containing protein n=1 Tax=Pseudarthrobacter sulfonivorans TaxID=121292 RepID=UPI00285846E5|nr:flavodoxin domain-containing protein [Pseudarthrobacter sulfonivorans]MDR6415800.1 menaquinone-dependent protoporphyrinogen oxidase [Pseudarthrobacter sulfonivorans]